MKAVKPNHVSFKSLGDKGILHCNNCDTKELLTEVYSKPESTIETCEAFYELHRSCSQSVIQKPNHASFRSHQSVCDLCGTFDSNNHHPKCVKQYTLRI